MTHPKGFTLIECAVALAILGVVAAALMFFAITSQREAVHLTERDLLERAEAAIVAFARINGRLPCPAVSPGGGESCGGGLQKGFLPAAVLGLPDSRAAFVRYGAYRAANADPVKDADLAVAKDRYAPLTTAGTPPAAFSIPIGATNGLDLCFALNLPVTTASLSAANANGLQVQDEEGNSRNVAFALATAGLLDADGDGNLFDGLQSVAGNSFSAPSRTVSVGYDDQVRAIGFDTLFGELACGNALSSAGHAHFNSAAGAAMMAHAMTDYQIQLDLAVQLAEADVAAAAAGVLAAAAGVAGAAAAMALAIAETVLSYGATSAIIALGSVAIAANAVSVALATAGTVAAGIALSESKARAAELEGTYHLVSDSAALARQIDANARAADAAGL
ncbi:type II secretion system protein [Uliginosibacterium sp. 31-16]|uniref:type II secretion system protein n=1 Tax=Uliginosibacterium sp. 31-16 TaxID=3068315 RepID=UPI00273EC23E|nr:type II secretion system protein [Uliginosibacterium sp. 31-16]MDP5238564.1 type II secretion system protein [Uliginosibacterium sp. 31-16]